MWGNEYWAKINAFGGTCIKEEVCDLRCNVSQNFQLMSDKVHSALISN